MNEETEENVNTILLGIIENAESVKNFTMEQAPDVVKQLLWWKGVESALGVVLGLLAIYGIYKWFRNYQIIIELFKKIDPYMPTESFGFASAFICIFGLAFACPMILANTAWIQILLAPKLYLIEYAASLLG